MKTDNLHTFSSYDNTAFQNAVPFRTGLCQKENNNNNSKVLARLQPTVLKTVFSGIFCTALLEEAALVE